ncbi:MAG: UDP-N-acetylglucosamine 2-epimerase [Anaerolineaceae bacterium]|jgi:UDP-N-acetylglucosamine 2-epimerase (non-hydrolysing)/GDP/UDP-N,N'-diacetylbacillosamine 2-epimerase (hydrolysing)|nr:UDP-N-acetylglucosamine 2-epimerase [Anaerolineaceae bacterium]
MRTIGVVTVGRSDFGIYRPVLEAIRAESTLELRLIVSGMHLSPHYGSTVEQIEAEGFIVDERVEMLLSSDSPEGIAKSMGLGTIGFAQSFAYSRPDLLLVLGDRFEMHAAALAALPFNIPVAHIHGGEVTEGAMDEALRHAITKLSHLHFTATEEYARRVIQLGEEPWRVIVSGAPGLDNLHGMSWLSAAELKERFGLRIDDAPLLVTFHPVTLEYTSAAYQIDELLHALQIRGSSVIFTLPNADTGNSVIRQKIAAFVAAHPDNAQAVESLGTQGYFSLMKLAEAMVGNSSSGIIEAASFALPVVNIGSRQGGRARGRNVIDVGYNHSEILDGIQRAVAPAMRQSLRGMQNPYGDGHAAGRIVFHLRDIPLDRKLIVKRFYDLPAAANEGSA